jgi:hypothetical protein
MRRQLDVDPEAYADEYGVEGTAAIHANPQQHSQQRIVAHFEAAGILR